MTDLVERLWQATKHGDADHQQWLHDAYTAFFSGQPIPAPRGKGNKEARIETLEAEITRLQRELGNQPRVRMCEPPERNHE